MVDANEKSMTKSKYTTKSKKNQWETESVRKIMNTDLESLKADPNSFISPFQIANSIPSQTSLMDIDRQMNLKKNFDLKLKRHGINGKMSILK